MADSIADLGPDDFDLAPLLNIGGSIPGGRTLRMHDRREPS
jgi:hypothetical protein